MVNPIVLIACHKKYPIPNEEGYLPIEVGAELHDSVIPGCIKDNTGDNISNKNKEYCELTALYWAWKNLNSEAIGLVHYRRYFESVMFSRKVVSIDHIRRRLSIAPVVLPQRRHYLIETNYSQYIHAHHQEDLMITREVISDIYPEYLDVYDGEMLKRSGHRFNMFIMTKELFDSYCQWLFDILFEVEKRLDISTYDSYNSRVFGFIAERLIDVWITKNSISYTELPVFCTEKQHWLIKGIKFIIRKINGEHK